jgi:hypothetical protein
MRSSIVHRQRKVRALLHSSRSRSPPQALYDSISAGLYNVVLTSLPIIAFALLDRPVSDAALLRRPQLYNNSTSLTGRAFWKVSCNGAASVLRARRAVLHQRWADCSTSSLACHCHCADAAGRRDTQRHLLLLPAVRRAIHRRPAQRGRHARRGQDWLHRRALQRSKPSCALGRATAALRFMATPR